MRIGVDFDNTVVAYDELFHRVAVEKGLIPPQVPTTKESVRHYLRSCGRDEDWTELQGYVYGARLQEAQPFPGVVAFFQHCLERGIAVWIISHKTRYPHRGPRYDLHEAAWAWLHTYGLHHRDGLGRSVRGVYFEVSRAAKLDRLVQVGCTHFVDDLPEFLAEPGFPAGTERILFDPNDHHQTEARFRRATSWCEIRELVSP